MKNSLPPIHNTKKLFKKFLFKSLIKLNKSINPDYYIDENERLSVSICRKLINDKNSKFLISPLSQKRYIKNDENQIFVVIHGDSINITNHVYDYDIIISTKMAKKLKRLFDSKVEESRLKLDIEIHSQVKHSLKKILNRLN
jgi:UDP-2,3-diacylglucosamine pyrophosphatase LpxH